MRRSSGIHACRFVLVALVGVAVLCVVGATGAAGAAAKKTVSAGFEAQSFASTSAGSAGGAVTGQKPESKLWYAQGSWWAAMVVPTSGAHDIYQLVSGSWVDTGVLIDSESTTREDVLWNGTHLYVLSRTPTASEPNRLRRFSFVGGAYQLDAGFPVNVPGGGAETTTIAQDSTGTLWLTYASSPPATVMVAHSVGNDQTWTAASALPASPASGLKGDDISAIIAFTDATGPAIGVEWDNENLQSDFFAVHRDGAPDTSWSVETTLSGTLQADDHMNLKTFDGSVYVAVKTATTTNSQPLIKLLVRSPSGSWSQYPVALYSDHNTRPIVIIDTSSRDLYIFMSKGDNPGHGIYYKETSLDDISFPSTATPFIVGPSNQTINNGTSTKQNVDATSGIVVMASDSANYWWDDMGAGSSPPPNTPPTANDENANVSEGTPTPITLGGSDAETCQLGFSIVRAPAHGSLGSVAGEACDTGTPNTDTATVTYTPAGGYTGSDSFTYQVTDGGGLTDTATVTITVTGSQNSPPTANGVSENVSEGTPTPITLSGSDAETCQLGFTVVQPPAHGSLGSVTAQACTAGTPNTDTATVTYTPTGGYTGADSFTYQVTDGGGLTDTATVTITVTGSQGPPTTAAPTSYKITTGSAAGGGLSSLATSDDVYLSIGSTTTRPRKTEWWGAFSGVPSNASTLSVTLETNSTASCTQTVQIRDWTTSSWVTLDSRTLGSTDTVVSGLVPPGSLSDYINSSGAVEVLVGCSASTTSYTFNADQLALTYGS